MKRMVWLIFLSLMLVILIGSAQKVNAKVFTWRMQNFCPPASFEHKVILPKIIDEIKKKTGGRLDIKALPPGAVCPPPAMFETVAKGGIEAILFSGPFYSGILPVSDVEWGLPFAWEDGYECNWMLWNYGLIDKVYRKAYKEHNIHLLGVWAAVPFGLMTRFPVHSVDDLKGRKIRAVGVGRNILNALGASTVVTPYAELYITLERGIAEGTYSPYNALGEMKLREVAQYSSFPPWINPDTLNILVNLDEWNKLPADIQKGCEQALRDLLPWLWEVSKKNAHESLELAKRDYKHTIITLPPEEVAKLKELALVEWKKIAQKDAYCKNAVEMIIEWNKVKGWLKD